MAYPIRCRKTGISIDVNEAIYIIIEESSKGRTAVDVADTLAIRYQGLPWENDMFAHIIHHGLLYLLSSNRIFKNAKLRKYYMVKTGSEPEDRYSEVTKWLNSCPSPREMNNPPMVITPPSTPTCCGTITHKRLPVRPPQVQRRLQSEDIYNRIIIKRDPYACPPSCEICNGNEDNREEWTDYLESTSGHRGCVKSIKDKGTEVLKIGSSAYTSGITKLDTAKSNIKEALGSAKTHVKGAMDSAKINVMEVVDSIKSSINQKRLQSTLWSHDLTYNLLTAQEKLIHKLSKEMYRN